MYVDLMKYKPSDDGVVRARDPFLSLGPLLSLEWVKFL